MVPMESMVEEERCNTDIMLCFNRRYRCRACGLIASESVEGLRRNMPRWMTTKEFGLDQKSGPFVSLFILDFNTTSETSLKLDFAYKTCLHKIMLGEDEWSASLTFPLSFFRAVDCSSRKKHLRRCECGEMLRAFVDFCNSEITLTTNTKVNNCHEKITGSGVIYSGVLYILVRTYLYI